MCCIAGLLNNSSPDGLNSATASSRCSTADCRLAFCPASSERSADAHLELRVNVKAGTHTVAVTFPKRPSVQGEDLRPPYLRSYVVARINPIRFSKSTEFDFDEVIDKMTASARKFNVEKVRQEDVVRAGGGPPDEE